MENGDLIVFNIYGSNTEKYLTHSKDSKLRIRSVSDSLLKDIILNNLEIPDFGRVIFDNGTRIIISSYNYDRIECYDLESNLIWTINNIKGPNSIVKSFKDSVFIGTAKYDMYELLCRTGHIKNVYQNTHYIYEFDLHGKHYKVIQKVKKYDIYIYRDDILIYELKPKNNNIIIISGMIFNDILVLSSYNKRVEFHDLNKKELIKLVEFDLYNVTGMVVYRYKYLILFAKSIIKKEVHSTLMFYDVELNLIKSIDIGIFGGGDFVGEHFFVTTSQTDNIIDFRNYLD